MIHFKKLYLKAVEGEIFYGRSIIAYKEIPWMMQDYKVVSYKAALSIDLWILTIDLKWIKNVKS